MILKIIITAIDAITILLLIAAQFGGKDSENSVGYTFSSLIFVLNLVALWN